MSYCHHRIAMTVVDDSQPGRLHPAKLAWTTMGVVVYDLLIWRGRLGTGSSTPWFGGVDGQGTRLLIFFFFE